MAILRKLLLVAFALAFAFVISSCNDKKKKCITAVEEINKEKQDRHHCRW